MILIQRNRMNLFKFKIQEYIVENNLSIDIYKMYEELEIYNPVISKSKNVKFIIHFIENELNYEEKLVNLRMKQIHKKL